MTGFQSPVESSGSLSETVDYKETRFFFTFNILSTHCYSSVWGKDVAELSSLKLAITLLHSIECVQLKPTPQ